MESATISESTDRISPGAAPAESSLTPFALRILGLAEAEGFSATGIVDLDPVLAHPVYAEHVSYYENWIRAGRHGEMAYLERGLERRRDPRALLPSAESLLAVAIPYPRRVTDDGKSPRYARYLYGPDYHDWMKERLERVVRSARTEYPNLVGKVCVDTSALLERTWAQFAGLGWIGKNTLLIHPKLGSYLFLGFVLLSERSGGRPALLPNYCGNCTKCLPACPTGALVEAGTLDSNSCIAYLTLEKRGPLEESKSKLPFRRFIAGCDLCQEACPYNVKPVRYVADDSALADHVAHLVTDLDALERETEGEYRSRVKGTALSRVKYADARRNLEHYRNESREADSQAASYSAAVDANSKP